MSIQAIPAAWVPSGGTSVVSYTAAMPSTGRPAAVQAPSPAMPGEVNGVNVAGPGSGVDMFGVSEVELVVGEVAAAVGRASECLPDRAEDVA